MTGIQGLVALAKEHGLSGSFGEWSKRDVWWFDESMPAEVRAAGQEDTSLEYFATEGTPQNRADEGFLDQHRLAISFARVK